MLLACILSLKSAFADLEFFLITKFLKYQIFIRYICDLEVRVNVLEDPNRCNKIQNLFVYRL